METGVKMFSSRVLFCIHLLCFFLFGDAISVELKGAIDKRMKLELQISSKFCQQKYFDTVSFDGKNIRFTVNRKAISNGLHHSNRYTFEQFELRYTPNDNSFAYSSTTFEKGNLLLLGGFYISPLNVYIQFFRNATNTKQLSVCSQEGNLHQLSENCYSIDDAMSASKYGRYFINAEANKRLKSGEQCAFVYDAKLEKFLYIFSNPNSPVVINSLRSFRAKGNSVDWFTKDIKEYRRNRFVGAFTWVSSTANKSSIFLLAQPEWKRTNLRLFELLGNSGKFQIQAKEISWQTFFGCHHKVGHTQKWNSVADKSTSGAGRNNLLNVHTILILALLVLIIGLAAIVVARKVGFGAFYTLFKRLLLLRCPISSIGNNLP